MQKTHPLRSMSFYDSANVPLDVYRSFRIVCCKANDYIIGETIVELKPNDADESFALLHF